MFDIHGGDLFFGVGSGEADRCEWKGIVRLFSLLSAVAPHAGGVIRLLIEKSVNPSHAFLMVFIVLFWSLQQVGLKGNCS